MKMGDCRRFANANVVICDSLAHKSGIEITRRLLEIEDAST
jgi:hypothetical protein